MKRIVLLVIVIGWGFTSCKKNQLNGSSNINGIVVHHNKAIPNARIFIKFNASEFPGVDTLVYDAKVVSDANGNFSIDCYKGNYYLFGYGHDLAIAPPYAVVGGVPVNIRKNEKLKIQVAVTEGD